jgi:hypothetical protein
MITSSPEPSPESQLTRLSGWDEFDVAFDATRVTGHDSSPVVPGSSTMMFGQTEHFARECTPPGFTTADEYSRREARFRRELARTFDRVLPESGIISEEYSHSDNRFDPTPLR